jgi:hypothetical protein
MKPSDELKRYLAALGRKGGKAKSNAKAKAARQNAKKPRPNRRKKNDDNQETKMADRNAR